MTGIKHSVIAVIPAQNVQLESIQRGNFIAGDQLFMATTNALTCGTKTTRESASGKAADITA